MSLKYRKLKPIDLSGKVYGKRHFDRVKRPNKRGGLPRVEIDAIWYNVDSNDTLSRTEIDGTLIAKCPQGLTVVRKGRGYEIRNDKSERKRSFYADRVNFYATKYDSYDADPTYELNCATPTSIGVGSIHNMSWGFVKPDGTKLFEPDIFSTTFAFSGGYALVGVDGKWGVIDTNGNFTVPLSTHQIMPLPDTETLDGRPFFAIGKGDDVIYVKGSGEEVKNLSKQWKQDAASVLECQGGAKIYTENGGKTWGIMGQNSEIFVPPIHRAISCFVGGVAYAPNKQKQEWCPIGPDGIHREFPKCLEIYYPTYITHHYPEKFSENIYENSVLWVRALNEYGIGLRDVAPAWIRDGGYGNGSFSVIQN